MLYFSYLIKCIACSRLVLWTIFANHVCQDKVTRENFSDSIFFHLMCKKVRQKNSSPCSLKGERQKKRNTRLLRRRMLVLKGTMKKNFPSFCCAVSFLDNFSHIKGFSAKKYHTSTSFWGTNTWPMYPYFTYIYRTRASNNRSWIVTAPPKKHAKFSFLKHFSAKVSP